MCHKIIQTLAPPQRRDRIGSCETVDRPDTAKKGFGTLPKVKPSGPVDEIAAPIAIN